MNYLKYKKKENLLSKLFNHLGIIKEDEIIIKINHFPDYDMSPYQGCNTSQYYFSNSWDFSNYFDQIISVDFSASRIFHSEDIERAKVELNIELNDTYDIAHNLNKINDIENTYFERNGVIPMDLDDFSIQPVRLKSIDQIMKKVIYESVFEGDNYTIDPIDWSVFTKIKLKGTSNCSSSFYKKLFAESYILYTNQQFKLSYFIAFTAFENFIKSNQKDPDKNDKLINCIKTVLASKIKNIHKHSVYTSVINDFNTLCKYRNAIAHGTELNSINLKDQVENLFYFALTLIIVHYDNVETFEDIITIINHDS